MIKHFQPSASRTAPTRPWLLALMLALLLASPLAQAHKKGDTTDSPPVTMVNMKCSGSGSDYHCGPLALAAGVTLSITSELPTTITVNGDFTVGAKSYIRQEGRALGISFVVTGTTYLGDGAHVTANLQGNGVVTLGDQVEFTGNITTGSGAINVGADSYIDGSIVTTVAGVVNVGAKSTVTGNITTQSGAVNMGADSHVLGSISSTLAGVVSIGANARVNGSITTVSGAINLGESSRVDGSVSDSIAGAITLGSKASVGGGVSTESGAITLGDGVDVGESVCTGLAGAITVGDNVKIEGNVSTNNGAITVGDNSQIGGTVGAAVGAVTVAKSAKTGSVSSHFKCPGSPGSLSLKSRQWRQIFMR